MAENDKKTVIVLMIILAIIVMVLVTIKLWPGQNNKYIIIDDTFILMQKGKTWEQVKNLNDDVLKQVYTIDNGKIQAEKIKLNFTSNKWYYMNDKYKNIDIDNIRVAYSNIDKISLGSFNSEYATDEDIDLLAQVLSKKGINNYQAFMPSTRKTTVDLDKDGTKEVIYTTTNISLSYDGQKHYAALFLVKNNEVKQVIDINEKNPYWVMDVLDLNNDDKYEVIVSKGDIDIRTFDSCYQIYEMKDGQLKLQKDCK